jgi:hypothetical protein
VRSAPDGADAWSAHAIRRGGHGRVVARTWVFLSVSAPEGGGWTRRGHVVETTGSESKGSPDGGRIGEARSLGADGRRTRGRRARGPWRSAGGRDDRDQPTPWRGTIRSPGPVAAQMAAATAVCELVMSICLAPPPGVVIVDGRQYRRFARPGASGFRVGSATARRAPWRCVRSGP